MPIKNFIDRDAENFWNEVSIARKYRSVAQQIAKRLNLLNAAMSTDDLRNMPSNHFEALRGKLAGRYSIRVNDKIRVVFKWEDGSPCDVEIMVDYH
jgi:proteic killer suppression protein